MTELDTWSNTGNDIGQQFNDAFFDKGNELLLPRQLYKNQYENRAEVLNHIAFNHPKPIVRTKACIILSRITNGLEPKQVEIFKNSQTKKHMWTIDVLRQLIARDWDRISLNITPRWCISILNCFGEHGTSRERVVANSISMMYNMASYGHVIIALNPADTLLLESFQAIINTMLRINMSLTNEMRQVVLTTMEISSDINKIEAGFEPAGVKNIATIWKMVIEKNLTTRVQVEECIESYFLYMDTENVSWNR